MATCYFPMTHDYPPTQPTSNFSIISWHSIAHKTMSTFKQHLVILVTTTTALAPTSTLLHPLPLHELQQRSNSLSHSPSLPHHHHTPHMPTVHMVSGHHCCNCSSTASPPPTTPTPTPTPTPTLQQLQQQRHTSATKNVFSVMSLSLYSYFSPSRTNPLLFSCICIISWQCWWHVSECQWHGVSLVFGATTYQQGRCHMWRHQRHYLSMSARHFILSTLPRFFMYVVRYVMNTNHKPQTTTMALKLAIDLR